jgi:hypothetical protein
MALRYCISCTLAGRLDCLGVTGNGHMYNHAAGPLLPQCLAMGDRNSIRARINRDFAAEQRGRGERHIWDR